jgi:hypothetical protein
VDHLRFMLKLTCMSLVEMAILIRMTIILISWRLTDPFYYRRPRICLINSKGLSAQQVTELSAEVEILAESLVGEVMIYELTQHIRVRCIFLVLDHT